MFEGVRLTGARFSDATLTPASFLDCDATGSDWSGAECHGAVWRLTALTGSNWTGARGHRPRFIRCTGAPTVTPGLTSPRFTLRAISLDAADAPGGPRPALRTLTGHQDPVNACAVAPDGARLLSAGLDGTLRLWDAASGAARPRDRDRPHPGWAVREPPTNRVVAAGGETWRWLAWVASDAGGWPDPLLETFGPIPGL